MTTKDGGFPNDFGVEQLMPPSNETRQAFEGVFADLSPLASTDSTKSVGVEFRIPASNSSIGVYCRTTDMREAVDKADSPIGGASLTVRGEIDGNFFMVSGAYPLDEVERGAVENLLTELDGDQEKEKIDWLRAAYSDAQLTDESLVSLSVHDLLDDSPFPPSEYTLRSIRRTFNNGSVLYGSWITANQVFLDDYPVSESLQYLHLTESDDTVYEYSCYPDGKERLLVKDSGERVRREVDPTESLDFDRGNGLTMSVRGTPEIMEEFRVAIAERREAQQLGLDVVTEGSLAKLTKALRVCLASGSMPPDVTSSDPVEFLEED